MELQPSDWIRTEVGYVRAGEVAAVAIEDRSSTYYRPSKGYDESIEWNVLVVVTRGGAKIVIADDRFGPVDLDAAKRLVEEIDSIVAPMYLD
jgi:hypothetical protein